MMIWHGDTVFSEKTRSIPYSMKLNISITIRVILTKHNIIESRSGAKFCEIILITPHIKHFKDLRYSYRKI